MTVPGEYVSRDTQIEKLSGQSFGVMIVGGGNSGAVSAAALAARGVKVALVDRGDFAGGTSQESSNLIWGGIKYLENYEFSLVRNLCRSRNRLMRAYPTNIREIRFLTVVDSGSPHGPGIIGAGASLYWLIGDMATRAPLFFGPGGVRKRDALVDTERVRGGVEYSDAFLVENDARFVFSFVRSATEAGAAAVNYMNVADASFDGGRWSVQLVDQITGDSHSATAKVLVNATGPYVDCFNDQLDVTAQHELYLSKGIHLTVPRISEHDHVLAFFDDEQRLFFVLPMGRVSVIGTTDTRVDSPEVAVQDSDRQFLLDQVNQRLDLAVPLRKEDIIAERVGVRPLAINRGAGKRSVKSWTSLSRKHVIEVDRERSYLSIFGGKLSDALNIGAEVCAKVNSLDVPVTPGKVRWYGESSGRDRAQFMAQARRLLASTTKNQDPVALWRRYDLAAYHVLALVEADPSLGDEILPGSGYILAEAAHMANTEMIVTLDDFLRRRTKLALLYSRNELESAPALRHACQLLFAAEATARWTEYFESDEDSP